MGAILAGRHYGIVSIGGNEATAVTIHADNRVPASQRLDRQSEDVADATLGLDPEGREARRPPSFDAQAGAMADVRATAGIRLVRPKCGGEPARRSARRLLQLALQ
jgi:hypothetical protein